MNLYIFMRYPDYYEVLAMSKEDAIKQVQKKFDDNVSTWDCKEYKTFCEYGSID